MSGLFSFKTGVPATDIVIHNDAGGTVDGIDIKFNALPNESLGVNTQRFENDILKPFGCSLSAAGVTIAVDFGTDTLTMQMRTNNGLWDISKANCVAQAIQYCQIQAIDPTTASKAVIDSIQSYAGDRMNPAATYITRNPTTKDLQINYTTLAVDVVGLNLLNYHIINFQNYVRNVLGLTIINSVNYLYSIAGATFTVEAVSSFTSEIINRDATRIAAATSQGDIASYFHSLIAGYRALA